MELKNGGNGEQEYSERDHQRQILEKILKKSKVKLDETERDLMDNLIAELDLLHLRGSELDDKLANAPGLMELILMAQQEEEAESDETQPTAAPAPKAPSAPQKTTAEEAPESSVARISPPKEPKKSTRPRSILKQRSEEEKSKQQAEERPASSTPPQQPKPEPTPAPQPEPQPVEKKSAPCPEMTVRKFIEAWNQKAFGAEYACFSKKMLNMGKEEYVDCRMDIYLSETKLRPVIRKMGTLLSKKVYGNNAEVLCERILQTGPKTEVFIDDYSLSLEDGDWKITAVRSEPDRSHTSRRPGLRTNRPSR